jgi:hypothetical protein
MIVSFTNMIDFSSSGLLMVKFFMVPALVLVRIPSFDEQYPRELFSRLCYEA